MFLENEIVIIKGGGEYKILAVSLKNMTIYTQRVNIKYPYELSTFKFDEVELDEERKNKLNRYMRNRKINDLLK